VTAAFLAVVLHVMHLLELGLSLWIVFLKLFYFINLIILWIVTTWVGRQVSWVDPL
jgi:hypothetical protein